MADKLSKPEILSGEKSLKMVDSAMESGKKHSKIRRPALNISVKTENKIFDRVRYLKYFCQEVRELAIGIAFDLECRNVSEVSHANSGL